MIDAGGGSFLRFGEAGARFEDLDFIGLSHLHTDHSAGLPALLKSGNFSDRDRPLPIAGPDGDGVFPGVDDFLTSVLDRDRGAYAYLSGFLDGSGDTPMLMTLEVAAGDTVAFRVRAGDTTIVFGSDQNGNDLAFAEFARDASILVMHMAVPEDVSGVGRRLHAPPSVIGEVARQANPGKLVLSHFMARSLKDLETNVALVRRGYAGSITVADDMSCVTR
jgi:ribonuclease BN (tRNA processing enzyme)